MFSESENRRNEMSSEFIVLNGKAWLSESELVARMLRDMPDKQEVKQTIKNMVIDNMLERTMHEGKVYYRFSDSASAIMDAMNRSGTA